MEVVVQVVGLDKMIGKGAVDEVDIARVAPNQPVALRLDALPDLELRGSVEDWGVVRRAISSGGSLYARLLLGVPVRDLTGGFKCFRRAVLETIDLDAIHSKGYAFQIELTYRALRRGFRVREVPIRFVDREVGGSKMSRSIVLEGMWKVPLLRLAALRGRL